MTIEYILLNKRRQRKTPLPNKSL